MEKVLVLGAGFAGTNAALKLARRGFHVQVIDVDSYHEFTPGIINLYRDRRAEKKLKRDLHDLFSHIDFSREVVNDIRPRDREVDTNAGTHEYNYLVVALGSEPSTYGMDISGAYTPYTMEDTKKVIEEIEDGAESATVVGSGYVGIEVGAELREKGLDVTIIEGRDRPMPNSNPRASSKVLDYMNRKDISIKIGQRVTEVNENSVELEDGNTIESDLVLWSAGIKANELVTETFGAEPEGVNVDSYLRYPEYENIYVIGDCAHTEDLKTAHNATVQGRYVGANLGKDEKEISKYDSAEYPLLVSLGKTGMMVRDETVHTGKVFRYMKDMVRKKYWFELKKMRYLG